MTRDPLPSPLSSPLRAQVVEQLAQLLLQDLERFPALPGHHEVCKPIEAASEGAKECSP